MTSSVAPSPRRANPFAKPVGSGIGAPADASFQRAELLPSPRKGPNATAYADGAAVQSSTKRALGSAQRPAVQRWRLLWRGGLEIGEEVYRLDGERFTTHRSSHADLWHAIGITFAAQLQFGGPSTPTTTPNGFDFTPARPISSAVAASPFAALPGAETDLCLSLESMKGRKTLRVRHLVPLAADEELETSEDAGGVYV